MENKKIKIDNRGRFIATIVAWSFILLAGFLFFFRLGETYLVNFDEAFYAVIAKEMANSGDFLKPTFGGEPFFAASPLNVWLEAFWMRLFSPSEFGVRFFAASSSLLTVILLYWYFAKQKNLTGFIITALVLLSTIKFLYLSRVGNFDATLTLFTTAAILFFGQSFDKPKFLLLAGLSSALAFLTKGIFGLFPLGSFLFFTVLFYRSLFKKKELGFSILILILIVFSWNIAAYIKNGYAFFQGFYAGHMATKIGPSPLVESFWWAPAIWQGMKVWIIALLVAFYVHVTNQTLWKNNRFILLNIFLYLVILSIVRTHNDWYLMPLYPVFAIIIGRAWTSFSKKISSNRIKTIVLVFFIGTFLFHHGRYYYQYVVPQTTDGQIRMIRRAESISTSATPILLDDFYYPVAMYYSDRPIIRLRANRDNNAAIPTEILDRYLRLGSPLLSNTETVDSLKHATPFELKTLESYGNLLLLVPN